MVEVSGDGGEGRGVSGKRLLWCIVLDVSFVVDDSGNEYVCVSPVAIAWVLHPESPPTSAPQWQCILDYYDEQRQRGDYG